MAGGVDVFDGDFLTWGQITVLASIIFTIVSSTGYLTRLLDRKLNVQEYETKHQKLRDEVGKLDLRLTRLEERHRKVAYVLEKNGIRE